MSPTYIRRLTTHGLQAVPYTADSLADAAAYEPAGVYTITNTYNTFQVLKLNDHLDRMEASARQNNILLTLDRPRLRQALRDMIEQAAMGDVRFRITAPYDKPQELIITLEPFMPPREALIQMGVRCVTVPGLSRHMPAAKTNDWVSVRQQARLSEGIYEGLLLSSDGDILEGLSSNFYAIMDGQLHTAGEGVLAGIAQKIVFDVAPSIIPLKRIAIRYTELPRLREAFITSSSRGIVPVIEIDGQPIGNGVPGMHTLAIRRAYQHWLANHLETL